MILKFFLILSVLLQFGAFIITIKLIPKTKFNSSWIMISIGFLLMAIRRYLELIQLISNSSINDMRFSNWLAILTSLLMFLGAFYIQKIFKLQDKLDKIRRENENHILSAIIQTEEKERKILAKELHDGLGPILSNIKMTLSAMNARLEDKKNLTLLQKSSHATDEAIIAIKEISNQLSPHNLERFGLEKAIKKFISDMHFPSKFEIMLNIEINNVRFDFNIELIIYRIICELVTNTIKHACANHLKIDIFNAYPKLMILYSDNGKGISLPTEQSDGMGISNIRSRVQSVHGNIEIDTKQNKGFSAKITIPIYN